MTDRSDQQASSFDGQSADVSTLRDGLLRRQQTDWAGGTRTSIDQLMGEFPGLQQEPELLLDLIYNELCLREELGESLELQKYQAQFPELSERLRIQWEIDRLLFVQPEGEAEHPAMQHRIGRYEIERKLGEGGIGVAYKAWDPVLRRVVALKLLKSGRYATSQELARFRTEAAAIARVRHENVVQVYDVGEVGGEPFIAMEYCAGGTLAGRLQKSVLSPREAADMVRQTGMGLAAVHHAQIIHRDLKPGNVFLQAIHPSGQSPESSQVALEDTDLDGAALSKAAGGSATEYLNSPASLQTSAMPKVSDFGLAKLLDQDDLQTRTGMLMGTPAYMAPEQALGGTAAISASVDVYALGAILYECLTGRPPFRASTAAETLDQVRSHEPAPIRQLRPDVPIDLQTIASKCLSKEPRNRYVSVTEVADELGRFLDGQPIIARPISRVERVWRWCRRNPGLASLSTSVFALLLCLTIGSLVAAILLRSEAAAARQAERKAIKADKQRLEKLYEAYLGESRASRRGGGLGQREVGVQAIQGILTAYLDKGLSKNQQVELRDEAIAALALPDLRAAGRHRADIFAEGTILRCASTTGEYPIRNRETGEITVHQLSDGKILSRLHGHAVLSNEVRYQFSECGTWLLEVTQDLPAPRRQHVRMWEWRTAKLVFEEGYDRHWMQFVAHPVTKKIIAWCEDSAFRRFDLISGKEESVSSREFSIYKFAFDSTGQKLVTTGESGNPEIVDTNTWEVVDTISEAGPGRAVAWHPSDKTILCGGLDLSIYEWDVAARKVKRWPLRERDVIADLWFSPTADSVAIVQPAGVSLQNSTARMPEIPGRFLGFYDSGRRIATYFENEVTSYERDSEVTCARIPAQVEYAEFSPDGRWLMLSGPHEVKILDGMNYSEVAVLAVDRPGCVVFDSRGRDFVTFGIFSHPWLWPIDSPDQHLNQFRFGPPRPLPIKHVPDLLRLLKKTPSEPEHFGRHVSFSADGSKLAIAGARNREILVWERNRDTEPRVFVKSHAAERVAMSPDGMWLAGSAEHAPEARVWNYQTRKEVLKVEDVMRVLFSPDSRWLAMAARDWVRLYSYDSHGSFQLAHTFERTQSMLHRSTAIAFSPDSKYFAMTGSASQIRLIELDAGEMVGHLSHPDEAIIHWLSFSPNGQLAATRLHLDIAIWNLPQIELGLSRLGVDHSPFPAPLRGVLKNHMSDPAQVKIDRGQFPSPGTWSDNWLQLAEHEIDDQNLVDAINNMSAALDQCSIDDWDRRAKLLRRRATFYQRNHNYRQAKLDLEHALSIRRDSRASKIAISRLATFGPAELRDPRRSIELLAPTLLKNQDQPVSDDHQLEWQHYGCALIRLHQHREGLRVLSEHPAPEDDPISRYMQAMAQHHLSEHNAARQAFESAAEIDAKVRPTVPPEVQSEWERVRVEVDSLIQGSN